QDRRLAFAHVCENQPRDLLAWIGLVLHLAFQVAVLGLRRLIEAAAVHVVEPAVIEAAQATIFQPAVAQVGATMGALTPEQADTALLVAKQDEMLAHDPDRDRRASLGKLRAGSDRLPVLAQELAAGRAGTGFGQQPILFGC